MDYKFGKQPAKFDERTLRLENYLNIPKLPPLPETSDWFANTSQFSMAGNDQYGDCGVAGAAHMIQTWTANAGRHEQIIPDKTVIQTYLTYTGYQDEGVVLLDFLKYWRKTGIAGHKIGAFAAIDPKNITSWRYANFLFGGVYSGFNVPQYSMDQFDAGKIWDISKKNTQIVGGHCVPAGITTPRMFCFSTWGKRQWATVAFVGQNFDEAYAILSLEWFTKDHKSPLGFYWKDLVSDLKAVAG